jgi:hypothetical protein
MKTRITVKAQIGKRLYLVYLDCYVDYTDATVIKGKYVSIFCHRLSVDEKNSDSDYKDAIEISYDGDYHVLIGFKNNPEKIRIFSKESDLNGKSMQFFIEGV